MGKSKRRFNLKGREVKETIVDNSETVNIKVEDAEEVEYNQYDQSNALVLPSKKRDTKIKKSDSTVTRILSKKQRKILEKVVERKQKKENRSSLLEALASVQIPTAELKQYTTISQAQTKGLKRLFNEIEFGAKPIKETVVESGPKKYSSIAGSSRKRQKLLGNYSGRKTEEVKKDLNNIGFDEEEDDEDDEEMDEKDAGEIEIENDEINETLCDKVEELSKEEFKSNEMVVEKEEPPKPKPVVSRNPATYVHVERTPEIQAARLKLPILAEEQVLMETINENQIVIVAGETGSGKTTQIPQFLYEAGYAKNKMIGVTEPRRVAAISMSNRVAEEMNLSPDIISYLIRFEGNTTEKTKIKFMTDGVLLKEIETDFLLNKYSVIILDEAHERSVYTDILVGLLSRIVPTRNKRGNPMKLIIMSATLRIKDFTENEKLFKTPPPVINVESRQFPVTVHFNKKTNPDYVKEAYNKAVKIHTKLPDGGILIFLTGQQEVNYIARKLRKAFPRTKNVAGKKIDENQDDGKEPDVDEFEMDIGRAIKGAKKAKKKLASKISLPQIDLDSYKLPSDDTDADLLEVDDDLDDDSDNDLDSENDEEDSSIKLPNNSQPLYVLPLYALLPSDKQALVFKPPPEGMRLCVVATNVAETSLTIPNIKYVVDTGRQKTRLYDKVTGVSAFVVTYTSKAGANQRAGRAGRTAPGHCYRIYSSAVFDNDFEEFSAPEIQKKPVDDLMLQMKAMGIDKVRNFPFPSPPDQIQLDVGEERLKLLGALKEEKLTNGSVESKITSLGVAISAFPVNPRFGKMLALSHQSNLLPYTICMVAALSVQEVLQEVASDDESLGRKSKWLQKRMSWAGSGHSLYLGDPMVLLRAVGASEYAGSKGRLTEFCEENGLRPKAISEIRKLRKQLTNEINLNMSNLNLCVDPQMTPPTDIQAKHLRQIMLAGMCDQVARRIPPEEIKDKQDKVKFKFAYQRHDMEDPVFLHQNSVLKKSQPDWVVYQEIYELQNGNSTKMFMRGITAIEPEWLPQYAYGLCNFGPPTQDPPPRYDPSKGKMFCHIKGTFGKQGWELPQTEIEFPISLDAFRYFAMFLLNGDVFPKLKKFVPQLLSTPGTMTKSWSNLIARTESIQNRLMRSEVITKWRLIDVWKKDSNFLLNEYQMWLPEAAHGEIALVWPPIDDGDK